MFFVVLSAQESGHILVDICSGYMAPEYLIGRIVTAKADIYNLGVIIIEIITGHKVNPLDNVSSCQDFVQLVRNCV